MTSPSPFKWRHFEPEIIVCGVRWDLRYAVSYRDVEELMLERGLSVDHTTGFRWGQRYAPELDQCCRPYLKPTNNSYRVDETYIKIKKVWHYLYRAVDSESKTLDFFLSPTRDAKAAKKFFRKVLRACHAVPPRVITVDKNAASPNLAIVVFTNLGSEAGLICKSQLGPVTKPRCCEAVSRNPINKAFTYNSFPRFETVDLAPPIRKGNFDAVWRIRQ